MYVAFYSMFRDSYLWYFLGYFDMGLKGKLPIFDKFKDLSIHTFKVNLRLQIFEIYIVLEIIFCQNSAITNLIPDINLRDESKEYKIRETPYTILKDI